MIIINGKYKNYITDKSKNKTDDKNNTNSKTLNTNTDEDIPITEHNEPLEVAANSEDTISYNALKNDDIIYDFHDNKAHNPPLYIKKNTYEKIVEADKKQGKKPEDPFSRALIKKINSYKIKIKSKNTTLKRKNQE